MVDLYKLISDLCEQKGVSGGKMCADIGVSRSFMTELKKGRAKTITFATAQKLADYFNVSVDYFDTEKEKTPDAEAPRDKKYEEIINLLHIVLAHHGQLEYGSPKEPMTPEAVLIHFLDYNDSRLATLENEINKVQKGEYTQPILAFDRRSFYIPNIETKN